MDISLLVLNTWHASRPCFPRQDHTCLARLRRGVDCDGFSVRSGKHIYNGRRRWQASGGCHYARTELAYHVCIMHGGPNKRHRSPNFASSPWPSLTTCPTSSAKTERFRTLSPSPPPNVWASHAGQDVGETASILRSFPTMSPVSSRLPHNARKQRLHTTHMTHVLADREQLFSRQYIQFPPPRFRPASTYHASQANRSTPCPRTRVVKQQQDRQSRGTPVGNMARAVVL